MARNTVDFSEVTTLRDNLRQQLSDEQIDLFMESCAKELTARLLAKVKRRTPVGDYSKEVKVTAKRDSKNRKKGEVYTKRINPSGKVGGTLRRGWDAENAISAITKQGDMYTITLTNETEYASYVEFGHRTRNHKGWVKGQFMLTISEEELKRDAPNILEKKLKKMLEGCFGK